LHFIGGLKFRQKHDATLNSMILYAFFTQLSLSEFILVDQILFKL